MSRRILICTQAGDVHALAVGAVLRGVGAEVTTWDPRNFPAEQRISLEISRQEVRLGIDEQGLESLADFDTIWLRRVDWHGLRHSRTRPTSALARRHSAVFSDRIYDLFGDNAFWVNHKEHAARAEFKPKQLEMARKVGFSIPHTLISNSARRIREFAHQHGGRVIAKPLLGEALMESERSCLVLYAEHLDPSMLNDAEAIEKLPYIYQEYVPAACEIRVRIMGRNIFAAQIKLTDEGIPDAHRREIRSVGNFQLPGTVREACLHLMESLGLVFGCIDLLLTADQHVIFLELNQAGQFLWLEHHVPECAYLASFCALLLGQASLPDVRLEQVLGSADFRSALTAHPPAAAASAATRDATDLSRR